MSMNQNPPIAKWQAGETVTGFALVARKERRQDRNGRDYIDLELTDNTGTVMGKIWADSAALDADFEAYDFVAFRGMVKSFRDQVQISIEKCRRTTEEDRARGFDEADLIPSTEEDIDELWKRLQSLLDDLKEPHLKHLASDALREYGDDLKEHPAAKTIHHAYRGGLLEHVVSMAELVNIVAGHYPELDRELLLVGVLFHDLGKLIEIGPMPANNYTHEGQLIGHVAIGRDLLRERCAAIEEFPHDLQVHLEHLVLSHQGRLEYGSPVEPRTAEAIVLHTIDNLDAQLAQLRQAARHRSGFEYMRGMRRMMYLGSPGDSDPGGGTKTTKAGPDPSERQLDLTAGLEPPSSS